MKFFVVLFATLAAFGQQLDMTADKTQVYPGDPVIIELTFTQNASGPKVVAIQGEIDISPTSLEPADLTAGAIVAPSNKQFYKSANNKLWLVAEMNVGEILDGHLVNVHLNTTGIPSGTYTVKNINALAGDAQGQALAVLLGTEITLQVFEIEDITMDGVINREDWGAMQQMITDTANNPCKDVTGDKVCTVLDLIAISLKASQ